ncbi:MAG TPA: hypothetical protein VGK10_10410 [Prolixibacteraceae bacterium]|jgi:hypothetical protein
MKKREKIMDIREQSGERMARESLWYFSEESVKRFSPIHQDEDSRKFDRPKTIIKGTDQQVSPRYKGKNKFIRECAFVVDWQLSDNL